MIQINTSRGDTFFTKYFTFAGGEVQAKIRGWEDSAFAELADDFPEHYQVCAKLHNAEDIMELMQVSHRLKEEWPNAVSELYIYYAPYAQQDRICEADETLACKVFAQMINSLDYSVVFTADCHSDVLPALIDRCSNIPRHMILQDSELATTLRNTECTLVSPDAGALKTTYKLAKEFGVSEVIRADKIRCTATGAILETVVYCEELNGAHCVITDDLCIGGRTFIELAKALKNKGAGMITLYVTHGIFSNGLKELLDAGITRIYTTDSRIRDEELDKQLNIIEL
jgi:ribose-phosphate pyrophosphokinase